ncbi:MAG: HupE/UreJ family protein [Proteobacteria bacterium]|nr:HupE/UreJ family protein [Pseudomonadota bacterium]
MHRLTFIICLLLSNMLVGLSGHGVLAHEPNVTFGTLKIETDRTVTGRFVIKGSDLERAAEIEVTHEGKIIDPERVNAGSGKIVAYLATRLKITNPEGLQCRFLDGQAMPEDDAVSIRGRWDCTGVNGDLTYTNNLLIDVESSARQLFRTGNDAAAPTVILDSTKRTVNLSGPPQSFLDVIWRFVIAGVQHIFIGFDHIAFLIALLLWARHTWPVVKVVTAFTVAHSITLTLAVLDVVTIPNNIAEALIAATIVYVAIENFYRRDIEQRWKITFLMGLVHGFGFASVLRRFGLPDDSVATALASFNVGVEIGQIVIVAICLPVLLSIDRIMAIREGLGSHRGPGGHPRRPAIVVHAASGIILILGLYWLAERTFLG